MRRALAFGGLALWLAAGGAAAEDRVLGTWVLDEAAFRAHVERLYEAAIAEAPAAERERATALAERAVDALVEQVAGSSATFAADGTVVLRPPAGEPQTGSWSRQGERILLEPAVDTPASTSLIGTFEDGRLELTPEQEDAVGFIMKRPAE